MKRCVKDMSLNELLPFTICERLIVWLRTGRSRSTDIYAGTTSGKKRTFVPCR